MENYCWFVLFQHLITVQNEMDYLLLFARMSYLCIIKQIIIWGIELVSDGKKINISKPNFDNQEGNVIFTQFVIKNSISKAQFYVCAACIYPFITIIIFLSVSYDNCKHVIISLQTLLNVACRKYRQQVMQHTAGWHCLQCHR